MFKGLIRGILLSGMIAVPAIAEDDWYPSEYGADDTLGALNNLSPEKVTQAAALIQQGKTYQLGGVTGSKTPAFGTRKFQMVLYPHGDGSGGGTMGAHKGVFNDDFLVTWLGIGTQIDGLGHAGIDHKYYNGVSVSDLFSPNGLKKYGTHTLPPIVTRGVLIDMTKYYGAPLLTEGTVFNSAAIKAQAKAQGITISKGDVVLFHTGWQSLAESDPERFIQGEPGIGLDGATYLADLGVVAIGADTWALEALPSETEASIFIVHTTLLAKRGVHILENIQTAELAADDAHEFMFVLGVPRFEGAVQMVINPVAIR